MASDIIYKVGKKEYTTPEKACQVGCNFSIKNGKIDVEDEAALDKCNSDCTTDLASKSEYTGPDGTIVKKETKTPVADTATKTATDSKAPTTASADTTKNADKVIPDEAKTIPEMKKVDDTSVVDMDNGFQVICYKLGSATTKDNITYKKDYGVDQLDAACKDLGSKSPANISVSVNDNCKKEMEKNTFPFTYTSGNYCHIIDSEKKVIQVGEAVVINDVPSTKATEAKTEDKKSGLNFDGTLIEADIGYVQDNPYGRPEGSAKQELSYVLLNQTKFFGKLTSQFALGGFFDVMLYQFASARSGLSDENDYQIYEDEIPPLTLALRQYNVWGVWDYTNKGTDAFAKLSDEVVELYDEMAADTKKQIPDNIQEFSKKWEKLRGKVLKEAGVKELDYREAFLETVEAKYISPADDDKVSAKIKATKFDEIQDEYDYFFTNKDSPYVKLIEKIDALPKHNFLQFKAGGIDTSHKQLGDLKYYMAYDGAAPLQMAGKGLGLMLEADQQATDWLFFKEAIGVTMMGTIMLGMPQFGYADKAIEKLPLTFAGSASANLNVGKGVWTPSLEAGVDASAKGLAWYAALSSPFQVTLGEKEEKPDTKYLWKPELLLSYSQKIPESGESIDRLTFATRLNFELPLGDEDEMYKLTISPFFAISKSFAGTVIDQHVTGEVDGESFGTDLDQLAGNASYEVNEGVESQKVKKNDYMMDIGGKAAFEGVFTKGLYFALLFGGASLCNGTEFCESFGFHFEGAAGYNF